MNKNIIVIIAVIGATIAAAVLFLRMPQSQSVVLNYPFDSVTRYMNEVFKTDVATSQPNHPSVLGPHFLDSKTIYTVETEQYEPGKLLRFRAWFAQIGGENNTFTIEMADASTTRLTINRTVNFIVTLPYWPKSERAIINAIETDLEKRNNPEQSVPGYPPQGVGSPEP